MKTTIAITAAALVAFSAPAFATGHAPGNSGNAKAMVQSIKDNGADIAPTVSGKNAAARGDSGWGNAGSRVTTGAQVSKSGKK
jgi:hypothetical protein